MEVKFMSVRDINPAPYNPRRDLRPGDEDYEKLIKSIDEFGCVEPLVWNKRTGNLVGGHQRFKVLLARGNKKVPVSVVDLPLEREKALNIALNKISGEWDNQKLASLLDELTKLPDFAIELTGFSLHDATSLIAESLQSREGKEESFDVDTALDRERPAITKPGEVIALGRHRLLCGDSSKPEDLSKLLAGKRVELLLTDPPYTVNYYGGDRPIPQISRPKKSKQWQRIYNDNKSQDDYAAWLATVLTNATGALLPGGCFYVWNGHRQFGPMHLALTKLGMHISCVITWAKETFAIGYGDYNQQTEFCLYGWKQDNGAHRWHGPTNESTLWQIHRDPTKSYQHPTQKPLELAERAIRNSTRGGERVLDCFLGSGTTLIGCERTGRTCFGMEIDPHYCDVIVRRFIAFAGDVPPTLAKRYAVRKCGVRT